MPYFLKDFDCLEIFDIWKFNDMRAIRITDLTNKKN